jgi:hypothetical protein
VAFRNRSSDSFQMRMCSGTICLSPPIHQLGTITPVPEAGSAPGNYKPVAPITPKFCPRTSKMGDRKISPTETAVSETKRITSRAEGNNVLGTDRFRKGRENQRFNDFPNSLLLSLKIISSVKKSHMLTYPRDAPST